MKHAAHPLPIFLEVLPGTLGRFLGHKRQVRLSSETELNRTQLNGFRSIGSGEPIQSKPKASPSKQVFLALFLLFIQ